MPSQECLNRRACLQALVSVNEATDVMPGSQHVRSVVSANSDIKVKVHREVYNMYVCVVNFTYVYLVYFAQ